MHKSWFSVDILFSFRGWIYIYFSKNWYGKNDDEIQTLKLLFGVKTLKDDERPGQSECKPQQRWG